MGVLKNKVGEFRTLRTKGNYALSVGWVMVRSLGFRVP